MVQIKIVILKYNWFRIYNSLNESHWGLIMTQRTWWNQGGMYTWMWETTHACIGRTALGMHVCVRVRQRACVWATARHAPSASPAAERWVSKHWGTVMHGWCTVMHCDARWCTKASRDAVRQRWLEWMNFIMRMGLC